MIYGKLSEFGVTEDCRALDGKVLKLGRGIKPAFNNV